MAIPLRSDIRDLIRRLLNDIDTAGGEIYNDDVIDHGIDFAFREMMDALGLFGYPAVTKEVLYNMAANTTTLTPATLGVTDFSSPKSVEERPQASSGPFTPVNPRQRPPQRETAVTTLGAEGYRWESGQFIFPNCSIGVQLRIRYFATAPTPASASNGSMLIDNSHNFLAYRAASIVAAEKGNDAGDLAKLWHAASLGPDLKPDGSGGYLAGLCAQMERARTQQQAQRPATVKIKN